MYVPQGGREMKAKEGRQRAKGQKGVDTSETGTGGRKERKSGGTEGKGDKQGRE